MIKPVGEGAQREGVGNDERDALCMQLYFQTLSLCLDKHNVQTHRSYRYRSLAVICSPHPQDNRNHTGLVQATTLFTTLPLAAMPLRHTSVNKGTTLHFQDSAKS